MKRLRRTCSSPGTRSAVLTPTDINLHRIGRNLAGLALVVGMGLAASGRASAIPAYARRTGLACSGCHQPLFARLNKLGWEFRRLGYRLPKEMNQKILAGAEPRGGEPSEGTSRYNYADTLSIMARMRYDDIARHGAKRFSQPYVADVIGFFSGPIEKNFGYFLEADLIGQAPTFNSAAKRFDLPESNFEMEFAEAKAYTGHQGSYLSTKVGQFGFGGVDGFGANDRPVETGRPMMFTNRLNEFEQDETQRGVDVGYTVGDNHFTIAMLNGLNSEGKGDVSRPINSPDWLLQYIRWLGKSGSSAQVMYYNGKTPLDDAGNLIDRFDRIFVLGNWRQPLNKGRAINLSGGYMHGEHDKWLAGGEGGPMMDGKFQEESYFLEGFYEITGRDAPYVRFDAFHNNETNLGAAFGGNPSRNTRVWTVGAAHMVGQYIRLNLEYQARRLNPGANQDMVRGQIWLMF